MFEGQKVRLRAYTKDDLLLAREYINDEKISQLLNTRIPFPFRSEDEDKWYESIDPNSNNKYPFAIELKDKKLYIGGCGINDIDTKNRIALIGIFIGNEYSGKGYGTDAIRILVDFCFNEVNVNKVKLDVFSFNKAAIHCYEKVGFKKEGTLREEIYRNCRYHDKIIMGLLYSEWKNQLESITNGLT